MKPRAIASLRLPLTTPGKFGDIFGSRLRPARLALVEEGLPQLAAAEQGGAQKFAI